MLATSLARSSQWLRDLPARTALRLTNRPYVRQVLGDRHAAALERHRPDLPSLRPEDLAIVEGLDAHGIHITSIDALGLPDAEELLALARELVDDFAPEARLMARSGRDFVILPPSQLVHNAEIFYWGLQDRLLDIAETYIGLPPGYDGVAINYTVADGREVSTRSWHRDWEDRRVLKVALYLHDVGEEGGPFELISCNAAHQCDQSGYTYGLAKDAELQQQLGPDYRQKIVSCTGAAGTVIFADTARFFHRGKPATKRDRAAIFYSYFARQPRHPFMCERTGMTRGDIYRLSEHLPERQRKAAQWRRSISRPVRLIPPASL